MLPSQPRIGSGDANGSGIGEKDSGIIVSARGIAKRLARDGMDCAVASVQVPRLVQHVRIEELVKSSENLSSVDSSNSSVDEYLDLLSFGLLER